MELARPLLDGIEVSAIHNEIVCQVFVRWCSRSADPPPSAFSPLTASLPPSCHVIPLTNPKTAKARQVKALPASKASSNTSGSWELQAGRRQCAFSSAVTFAIAFACAKLISAFLPHIYGSDCVLEVCGHANREFCVLKEEREGKGKKKIVSVPKIVVPLHVWSDNFHSNKYGRKSRNDFLVDWHLFLKIFIQQKE